jgi:P27 family predicted phage terminase small subunit
MGLRGPAPKPTALKQAQGNPGRRRLNDNEPIPPAGEVGPPSWLGPQAREVWLQLSPVMLAMRVLTTADVWTFGRYCTNFARWLELRTFLAEKGPHATTYPVKDEAGNVRAILELPQAREFRRLDELLLKSEREFGLTPSARSRIQIEPGGVVVRPEVPDDGDNPAQLWKLVGGGGPAPPKPSKGKRASA